MSVKPYCGYRIFALKVKLGLSVIQLPFGFICICAQIVLFVFRSEFYVFGAGFWSGGAFFVIALVGIYEFKRRTKYSCVTAITLISCTLLILMCSLGITTVDFYYEYQYMSCERNYLPQYTSSVCSSKKNIPNNFAENNIMVYFLGIQLCVTGLGLIILILQLTLYCLSLKMIKSETKLQFEQTKQASMFVPVPDTVYPNVLSNYYSKHPNETFDWAHATLSTNTDQDSVFGTVFGHPPLATSSQYGDYGVDNAGFNCSFESERKRCHSTSTLSSASSDEEVTLNIKKYSASQNDHDQAIPKQNMRILNKSYSKSTPHLSDAVSVRKEGTLENKNSKAPIPVSKRYSSSNPRLSDPMGVPRRIGETLGNRRSNSKPRASSCTLASDYSRPPMKRQPTTLQTINLFSLKPFDHGS